LDNSPHNVQAAPITERYTLNPMRSQLWDWMDVTQRRFTFGARRRGR